MIETIASSIPALSQRREKNRRVVPMGKWAFFDDDFVPLEQAKVSIATHAFNYGTGCFGGMRAYWNDEQQQLFIFRAKKHFSRFLESCRLLNIQLPYSGEDLLQITLELLRRDEYRQDAYMRPIAYKATEDITPRLYDLDDAYAMFTRPQGNYIKLEVSAGTSSWRRVDDNSIPARGKITGAYINSAFARTEAHWNGYDEAVVLNQDGHVSEGSAENFFMVRQGKLVTPPQQDNILEGVTRATVMELAKDELGLEVSERPIDRSELYLADEAFFTGTGAQVSAITSVDHRTLGDGTIGDVTRQIQALYFRTVRGNNDRYAHWLTPVYPRLEMKLCGALAFCVQRTAPPRMRQLYLPPTLLDRLPEWLRAVLRDRYVWAMLIIALLVNLGLFAFLLLVADQLPQFVSMHFDALGVADRIEDHSAVFTLPQIGLIVILFNFGLLAFSYRREPLASYLLGGMAIVVQFLLWFAAVGIVRAALLI